MRLHKLAFDSYGAVQVTTGVATADSTHLILMLFDGLLESMDTTRGHILHGNIEAKGKSISRASRIVLGLRGALDFEHGGEIATNLDELYDYVTRRLLHVNAQNDLEALSEIRGLMVEIREAWATLPGLLAGKTASAAIN